MDNFLQLVPMEADADDSDSALVYGEEDDLAVHDGDDHDAHDALSGATAASAAAAAHDSAAQFFAPLAQFVAASAGVTSPTSETAPVAFPPPQPTTTTPEQQRARFLELLQAMESDTRSAQSHLDKRLDTVRRIRAMEGDVVGQVAAFLPLLAEQQREQDAGTTNSEDRSRHTQVAAELLECARQMSDPRDAEVALVAAFVCASDPPHSSCSRRNPSAIAPAVAALLDESGALLLDQHHDAF